jgi:serine protease Do
MPNLKWLRPVLLGWTVAVLLAPWLVDPSPAWGGAAEEVEKDFIRVVDGVMPAVVSIDYLLRKEPLPPSPRMGVDAIGGSGSGFIILPKGYIVTNAHVLFEDKPAKKAFKGGGPASFVEKITVTLSDGRKLPAQFIFANIGHDLAVIKIDGDNFPAARLGDSDQLKPGQWAIAIGNPLSLRETVTVGVISAVRRPIMVNPELVLDFIQTSAPITYGNSGGPLIDIHGRIVGINSIVKTMEEQIGTDAAGKPVSLHLQAQALGFAIPIRRALDILRPHMQ